MLILALAVFLGGIVSALAGWADSSDSFNVRKFLKSGIAALIAGGVWAVGQGDVTATPPMAVVAFLTGAGADVLSNRIMGTLAKR